MDKNEWFLFKKSQSWNKEDGTDQAIQANLQRLDPSLTLPILQAMSWHDATLALMTARIKIDKIETKPPEIINKESFPFGNQKRKILHRKVPPKPNSDGEY